MTGLRRALVSVAFAGVIVGAAAAALVASSDHISRPGLSIVIGLVICWSFIGTGLYAWWRRPTNRFGALMTAVGFTFALGVLTASDNQVVFTIGVLLSSVYFVVFAHMVRRVSRRAARAPVACPAARGRLCARAARPAAAAAVGLQPGHAMRRLPGVGAADRAQRQSARHLQRHHVGARRRDRRGRAGDPAAALEPGHGAAAARARPGAVVGRRACSCCSPARSGPTPPACPARPTRSAPPACSSFASVPWVFLFSIVRSGLIRAGAVSELLLALGEAPGTGVAALPAGRRARRPLARPRVLARGQEEVGRLRRPRGRAARRRRGAVVDAGRARGPPRRRDRARLDAQRGARAARARSLPPPAWRWRTSACRPSCAPASRSCAPRAPGSSRPARRSAAGSSATCTTAPSSASSRCR